MMFFLNCSTLFLILQLCSKDWCIDRSRTYCVDTDLSMFQIDSPCTRKRTYCRLGCTVNTNPSTPLDVPIEAFKMIEPPSWKIGSAFCTVNKSPLTLMPNILSKCSSEISPNGANCAIPALANSMSRWPF